MELLNNIKAYITGNYRYTFYYSKHFKFVIRKHIMEQIQWRIMAMDRKCFTAGSCQECGCLTTALQMANKACNKPCYPKMMGKKDWRNFILNYKRLEANMDKSITTWSFSKPYKTVTKNGKSI